ncbi:MAG: hypothetical protein OEZ45_04315 [Candidatus Aminicenantes bacterium]|nr:hypothetical protein [Candidatus Aminicenantes bacterium]
MRFKIAFPLCLVLAAAFSGGFLFSCQKAAKKVWAETFDIDKRDFVSTGANRYFILEPSYQLRLEGQEGLRKVMLFVTVLDETRIIDGVETRVVEEREFKSGQLVEVSRNFFALNTADNGVYYFGEEVDIYKNGKITGHEGAWESGKDGAKFGLMVPGTPVVGARYYQEIAPKVAMDRAEIVSITESLKTPAGEYRNCLKTEETTPLEPREKEYKIYAPGIGLVQDGPLRLVEYGPKR